MTSSLCYKTERNLFSTHRDLQGAACYHRHLRQTIRKTRASHATLWREPRCSRSPSHQRSSISSSTICAMTRLRSKSVASSPHRGFRGPEDTFSFTSSSTVVNPSSDPGRRPSQILPTRPLITHILSRFTASDTVAVGPPSLNYMDCRPPFGPSACPVAKSHSQSSSV
jgi:hypothetical protein